MLADDSESVTLETVGRRPRSKEKPLSKEGSSILELERLHDSRLDDEHLDRFDSGVDCESLDFGIEPADDDGETSPFQGICLGGGGELTAED